MPISLLINVSVSRIEISQDLKLLKTLSNIFIAGGIPREAKGGMSYHNASSAQCFVLCNPDLEFVISCTIEIRICLSLLVLICLLELIVTKSKNPFNPFKGLIYFLSNLLIVFAWQKTISRFV